MWISEDAAKTSVRADISCQVFAHKKTETWKRVSVLRPSFCPSSWSVLSQENIFGRPQESQGSNPNITLETNAVTCRQNFYGQIHRSRCGRQTTKLSWIYNGLFAALSLIAFSQTSLENLADWLKFKFISLIKRRQKSSRSWGKYWKKKLIQKT